MFEILEFPTPSQRIVLGTFPSFDEAKDAVTAMGVIHMEDDDDYPGCADAYLTDQRIICVQPVGFKIAA